MPPAYRINDAKVIHEIIDGDAIMINLDNGNYYAMNETGVLVWSLLQQGGNVADVAAMVSGLLGVPAAQAEGGVKAFAEHLMREEVVSEQEGTAVTLRRPDKVPAAYTPPELLVFSDMQELLLLDPIHESSEQGWPHSQKK